MSLPDNSLSSEYITGPFDVAQKDGKLTWRIRGALGLQDPTYGLEFQEWLGVATRTTRSETEIKITPSKEGEEINITLPEFPIDQFSFAFDQNMFLVVAYVACGQAKFRWYDTDNSQYVMEELDPSVTSIVCAIDDNRQFNIVNSDIILAYIKGEDLCMRVQRDRYGVEYTLTTGLVSKKLTNIGMSDQLRFQFEMVDKDGWTGREPSCTSRGN